MTSAHEHPIDPHAHNLVSLNYEISIHNLGEPPPEFIQISTPGDGWNVGALEELTSEIATDLGWDSGYFEDYTKKAGGIGADGITILTVSLAIVQTIPTVQWILEKLHRTNPGKDSKEGALRRAEAAVLNKYRSESRAELELVREAELPTHWSFRFRSATSGNFDVDVHGIGGGTAGEYVTWTCEDAHTDDR